MEDPASAPGNRIVPRRTSLLHPVLALLLIPVLAVAVAHAIPDPERVTVSPGAVATAGDDDDDEKDDEKEDDDADDEEKHGDFSLPNPAATAASPAWREAAWSLGQAAVGVLAIAVAWAWASSRP